MSTPAARQAPAHAQHGHVQVRDRVGDRRERQHPQQVRAVARVGGAEQREDLFAGGEHDEDRRREQQRGQADARARRTQRGARGRSEPSANSEEPIAEEIMKKIPPTIHVM